MFPVWKISQLYNYHIFLPPTNPRSFCFVLFITLLVRDVRYGHKVGQIVSKWDKSGTFSIKISVHLVFKVWSQKCTENISDTFWTNLTNFGSYYDIPVSSAGEWDLRWVSNLRPNWVRLAQNGTNQEIFKISFSIAKFDISESSEKSGTYLRSGHF